MTVEVDEELWNEFHRVVNMTSKELGDWLRTEAANPDSESYPDAAGPAIGRQVLAILGKRPVDLTESDTEVMRAVVDRIHAQRRDDLAPKSGDAPWRHHLMSLGHDPLKPV